MNLLNNISVVYHCLKLVINPDNNIKSLLIVGDTIAQSKASTEAVKRLMDDNQLNQMYNERSGLDQMDLSELKNYKVNSFGKDIYNFYKFKNLDVYPMKQLSDMPPEVYVSERIRKVHDLLHVVLEYDTDLIGEAKVNAFVASQLRMPMSFLIICGIMIKFFFKNPGQFQLLIDGVLEAWKKGSQCQNFLTMDWDLYMNRPTEDVRQMFLKYQLNQAA